ncbi:hypothetical protein IPM19_00875 [bacterium]|nr:MAG: hypothetical protein IPM19_00875 [bacterium]
MKYALTFLGGVLFCTLTFFWIKSFFPEVFYLTQPPKIALADIPEQDIKQYKKKHVEVKAGKYQSSGCEIEPGVFLTAFHGVMGPWLDEEQIYVNETPAKLAWHSKTEQDYAILTTKEKFDAKKYVLDPYEFKIGDDIVIVGSPGSTRALVQPGKIINTDVKNEDGNYKMGAKKAFTIYIESGISGGCVYPLGSNNAVAVMTKKDNNPEKTIGEISLVSKISE